MDPAAVPIVVTDGEQRSALAVVRTLGRRGHPVYVVAQRPHTLAAASRFARASVVVPDPLERPAAFVDALASAIERWRVRVLLPVSEPSLLAVLDAPGRFADVCVPFPDAERFRAISDKARLLSEADALGIATPRQWVAACPEAVERLLAEALPYPLVLKPARSVGEGAAGRVKVGVAHARDASELRARVAEFPDGAFPLLLQQRVVGPGIGIFVLRWQGQTLATFAHRRIREKPPSGGVSVYRESVAADPELEAASTRLLDRFGWSGVAMVEYKVDAASGVPYLMEVNGRFWGSLQLALDAGVDFPSLLVDAALGKTIAAAPSYRCGVRSRWWWGDVDQLVTLLRRSNAALALPPDAPARWRSILDFLTLWRPGDRNEIFRWSDPAPFFRESVDWFARR